MLLGFELSRNELIMIIVIVSILIVLFIILTIHIQRGHEFYKTLDLPNYAPPPWLFYTITGILLATYGVGGWVILTQTHKNDLPICLTLWITSGILLWAAYMAFFERQVTTEPTYLLFVFLALHIALLFKFQFVNRTISIIYLGAAIFVIYLILVMIEIMRLN